MARKPRIHYSGALYHVTLRGNARQDVFFEDGDRYRFHLLLQEGLERYEHRIHAFCLMTNHIHLALQSGEIPLSRFMHNLSFRYTRWINWRLNRSGHLFQGRFKAVLVDADAYLLELVRYIHLNPVRAGMLRDPGDYPWSSHNAYCGRESIPWLTTKSVWSRFSAKKGEAINGYGKFVMDGIGEEYRAEFHGGAGGDGRMLGDDAFIDGVMGQTGRKVDRTLNLERVINQVCHRYGIEQSALKTLGKDRLSSEMRGMAAWLVLETGCATLAELTSMTERDISTLSSAAKRLQLRAKNDARLASIKEDLLCSIEQNAIVQA